MKESLLCAYRCLKTVYSEKGFSSIELNEELQNIDLKHRPLASKIVYGVLDRDIELDFIIRKFASSVKPAVMPILKIGVYAIKYLSLANHAVVNACVDLTKQIGKSGVSGFVNATLKNILQAVESNSIQYPADEWQAVSVKQSFPFWALQMLRKNYGDTAAKEFAAYRPETYETHLRINKKLTSEKDFCALLQKNKIQYKTSSLPDAFCVTGNLSCLDNTLFTPQSASSMVVCLAAADKGAKKVLDVCAAPGGKSVYLAELLPDALITSCDIHPHRVELIKKYAARMQTKNIKALISDATVFNADFENSFDIVLCDVPCSGFGVLASKPDIKLLRNKEDIHELAKLQAKILSVAAKYVKSGGILVYSTCTVFSDENEGIVKKFLTENNMFEAEPVSGYDAAVTKEGFLQFLPHRDGMDGFFVAKLRRTQ